MVEFPEKFKVNREGFRGLEYGLQASFNIKCVAFFQAVFVLCGWGRQIQGNYTL